MSNNDYIEYELVQATLADVKPGEIFYFGNAAPKCAQDNLYFMTANGHMYSLFSAKYFAPRSEHASRPVRVERLAPEKVYFPVVGTVIATTVRGYVRIGPNQWKCTDPTHSTSGLFTDAEMFYQADPESYFKVVYEPEPPVHLLGDQDEG